MRGEGAMALAGGSGDMWQGIMVEIILFLIFLVVFENVCMNQVFLELFLDCQSKPNGIDTPSSLIIERLPSRGGRRAEWLD